ncbi:MAG: SDR family NAD(P)-dependent oxidoreductase [Gammaproteobacteria bacterium]|nr:SDR family NAD(P)-dependent oxidoreductase [Gammaproteobacteria bacterium]
MRRFEDIRCLVTGAADGIGHATAAMLLAEGGRVLVCDRNPAGLEALQGAAKLELDVTAEDAAERLMQAAQSELGGLDVLVNNAGIAAGAPVETLTDELWRQVLDVNLDAVFRISRAAIPLLKLSERGRIVNIGSVMSTMSSPAMGVYAVSKHAVAALTKTLALELGEYGITANYVRPGAIVTGLSRDAFDADENFRNFWVNKSALRRLGQPEDIANAIVFLASEEAAFITGHGLLVDGGALQTP